ncbi:MAG: UDP-N-acetylglucosamine 2-epimerase [Oscillospiraceae bacterium]
MKKIKFAVITSTRAEYGILYPLISAMIKEDSFETQVIVTGTHLLSKYGNTISCIEADEIPISYKVPIMSNDKNESCDVISAGIKAFHTIFEKEMYDAIILLGDRYELFAFAVPAVMHRIPIIHIHGGEKTKGAMDEKIRHAITKMSSVHFASTQENANRIVQMGEQPSLVFTVGALGIDNIMSMEPEPKDKLSEELGLSFDIPTALVTFHPVTMDTVEDIKKQAKEVFSALNESGIQCIVTMPNSDIGGDEVLKIIMNYVEEFPDKFYFFKNLGSKRYISTMHYVSMLVGNTSSGIIEAPSFNIATVNIGDRQEGRFAPETVINCKCNKRDILNSIELALSDEFKSKIKEFENPYGDGHATEKMINILKEISWNDDELFKKEFFDN